MGGFELIPTAPCVGSARIKALLDTHTTQSLNANWPAQTPQPRQPVGRSPPRAVQRRPQAPSGGPSPAGGSPAQGRAQATQSYDTITTLTVQYQPKLVSQTSTMRLPHDVEVYFGGMRLNSEFFFLVISYTLDSEKMGVSENADTFVLIFGGIYCI